MERDTFDENFERFLRYNANNLRMRTSDKVWNNISRQLHRRRRRVLITISAFLIAFSSAGYLYIMNSTQHPAPIAVHHSQNTIASQPSTSFNTIPGSTSTTIASNELKVENRETSLTAMQSDLKGLNASVPMDMPKIEYTDKNTATVSNEEVPIAETNTETPSEPQVSTDVDNSLLNSAERSMSSTETVAPLKLSASGKKLQWFLTFTPTISYRKLGENKSYMREVSYFSAPNTIAPLYSVNSAVTHKPNMGFELGLTSKYTVAKGMKLTGGLQFNINRYDIKAFNAPWAVATIRLNSSSGPDSLRTLTTLSNTNGYKANWLQNFYFQVSVPIGFELRTRGDDRMGFGFSSSIQPTYVLGDRAYLITADYQNYAQVPWLMRRWNVNTNFQTFVSYSAGRTQWQVGPQVRYQLLSSFVTKYPVKENLFDFGLKVGVSLNK
jgi:hypothetical protein